MLDQRVIGPAKGEIRQPIFAPVAYVSDGMVPFIRLQDVPLGEALHAMLRPLKLDYRVEPGFVWISTPARLGTESFEYVTNRIYVIPEGTATTEDALEAFAKEFFAAAPPVLDSASQAAISKLTFYPQTRMVKATSVPTRLEQAEQQLHLNSPEPAEWKKPAGIHSLHPKIQGGRSRRF